MVALVAADLRKLWPQVQVARLVLAGTLLDVVELLRPDFPVWQALDELAMGTYRGTLDGVISLGSQGGRMPTRVLDPDPAYTHAGRMRLMPFSLLVPEAFADALSEQLETQLMHHGEAGQATADQVMRMLDVRLEHARYLSRNDLIALTCVQYEHMNLGPLWSLLESALLAPHTDVSVLGARGLRLHYTNSEVQVQSPAKWLNQPCDVRVIGAYDFAGLIFELRQYAALLDAHHIALRLQDSAADASSGYLIACMNACDPEAYSPECHAYEAPALGIITLTVVQRAADDSVRTLAHVYPLQTGALDSLMLLLRRRYGTSMQMPACGCVVTEKKWWDRMRQELLDTD